MTLPGPIMRRLAVVALFFLAASPGFAQTPAEFYRGKTVELYIAYSAGGGYDLYARMVARHLGRHIPGNPQVVRKNRGGARRRAALQLPLRGAPGRRHGDRPPQPQ